MQRGEDVSGVAAASKFSVPVTMDAPRNVASLLRVDHVRGSGGQNLGGRRFAMGVRNSGPHSPSRCTWLWHKTPHHCLHNTSVRAGVCYDEDKRDEVLLIAATKLLLQRSRIQRERST